MDMNSLERLLDDLGRHICRIEQDVKMIRDHLKDQDIDIQNLYRRSESWPILDWADEEYLNDDSRSD